MTGEPLVPVILKNGADPAPDAAAYYVVAANGLFLVRETALFSASVPADRGVPGLENQESYLRLRLPRLPRRLLELAMGFFRAVYDNWQGEGLVMLFYAPRPDGRPGRFALAVPPQTIRGRYVRDRFQADLRLEYGTCERPGAGYVKLGTFHSHAEFGPAHSGVDAHDELFESGLHLTAGYVDSARPEFAAAFVVGRTRFDVPVDRILPPFRAPRTPPSRWLEQITVESRSFGSPSSWGTYSDGTTTNFAG